MPQYIVHIIPLVYIRVLFHADITPDQYIVMENTVHVKHKIERKNHHHCHMKYITVESI